MREFFIRSFEILVGVIVVIMSVVVLIAGLTAMFGGGGFGMMGEGGSVIAGLAILFGGAIYIIFMGGLMYLGLGIYQNTKKTAEAMERMRGAG